MIKATSIRKTKIASSGRIVETFQLVYPLFIHAELLTHRVFSKNGASARAIPVDRMIDLAQRHSTAPPRFYLNQPGMSAAGPLEDDANSKAHRIWADALQSAAKHAKALSDKDGCNVHKQWANRLLMPFTHMSLTLTGDEFENFYGLRINDVDDDNAQPEINELATSMRDASKAAPLNVSDFHIPYASESFEQHLVDTLGVPEKAKLIDELIHVVAKISRESYMRTAKDRDIIADSIQIQRLMNDKHLHASPFEHIVFGQDLSHFYAGHSGNFQSGCAQLRHASKVIIGMGVRSEEITEAAIIAASK